VYHKPVLLASATVALLAVAAGCRQAEPPPSEFRARLLTSLPTSGRWERAAEQGLGRIAAELDSQIARLRAADEIERRRRLRQLAESGAQLVFCVGPGFEKMVYNEAPAFPHCRFVLIPGGGGASNVASISFLADGAGYVAGVLAASLDRGSRVGVLRGSGGAWLEGLEEGFALGFRSVHSDAEVVTAAPPEGPLALSARQVAVALYAADRGDPRVLDEAAAAGMQLVVTIPELMALKPHAVVATVSVDLPEAMVRIAREVRDGTFQGGSYVFDFGSGVLDVELNPDHPAAGERAVLEALEVARSEVTAGFVELEQLGM
jgi:basic membrane protein A